MLTHYNQLRDFVGTDATIAQHIATIISRNYVNKEDMYFVPTTLGVALCKG